MDYPFLIMLYQKPSYMFNNTNLHLHSTSQFLKCSELSHPRIDSKTNHDHYVEEISETETKSLAQCHKTN